jgi:single-strand selective monofunctional uracil DNA glycosylase
MRFATPVSHVYDPVDYASRPHFAYLRRFGQTRKRVIFLGMNPGPYGMAQTGVPFGEIHFVRDWMGIRGSVRKPAREHPKRPILGFDCPRSEVSGARLWGAIAEHWKTPDRFFADHFVANYCPLVFMEASGRNLTPDKLPRTERNSLYEACDRHLQAVVGHLQPEWVVGIGKFAETRARAALGGAPVRIGSILHPSPASPAANRDWSGQAAAQFRNLGLCRPERVGPRPTRR